VQRRAILTVHVTMCMKKHNTHTHTRTCMCYCLQLLLLLFFCVLYSTQFCVHIAANIIYLRHSRRVCWVNMHTQKELYSGVRAAHVADCVCVVQVHACMHTYKPHCGTRSCTHVHDTVMSRELPLMCVLLCALIAQTIRWKKHDTVAHSSQGHGVNRWLTLACVVCACRYAALLCCCVHCLYCSSAVLCAVPCAPCCWATQPHHSRSTHRIIHHM
jgi:hypothetical protein